VKRNLVQEVMDERIMYGGFAVRRATAWNDMLEARGRNGERLSEAFVDREVMGRPEADAETVAALEAAGLGEAAFLAVRAVEAAT